jgi:hypothetical protein
MLLCGSGGGSLRRIEVRGLPPFARKKPRMEHPHFFGRVKDGASGWEHRSQFDLGLQRMLYRAMKNMTQLSRIAEPTKRTKQ